MSPCPLFLDQQAHSEVSTHSTGVWVKSDAFDKGKSGTVYGCRVQGGRGLGKGWGEDTALRVRVFPSDWQFRRSVSAESATLQQARAPREHLACWSTLTGCRSLWDLTGPQAYSVQTPDL